MERGTIVVVDDEPNIADLVELYLARDGYRVLKAATGEAGLEAIRNHRPRLVVLDVGLPDVDGLEVCRRLREESNITPVLLLTARDTVSDKVAGLALSDDYVTKPFSVDELLARVRAILRRSEQTPAPAGNRLSFLDLVVDTDTREVWRAGQAVQLTATEFNLLAFLLRNARRVVSKREILDEVWEGEFAGESNIVEIYISYLRKKIDCFEPPLIHTVRRVGYSLREPMT
jgi:two-component system OmpR family response regulator